MIPLIRKEISIYVCMLTPVEIKMKNIGHNGLKSRPEQHTQEKKISLHMDASGDD